MADHVVLWYQPGLLGLPEKSKINDFFKSPRKPANQLLPHSHLDQNHFLCWFLPLPSPWCLAWTRGLGRPEISRLQLGPGPAGSWDFAFLSLGASRSAPTSTHTPWVPSPPWPASSSALVTVSAAPHFELYSFSLCAGCLDTSHFFLIPHCEEAENRRHITHQPGSKC